MNKKIRKNAYRRFLHTSYVIRHTSFSRASRGFTLIETLVAVALLLLSITTPLTIAEKGLAATETSRHEIVALYLAQEAIEYIRNVRDSNAIAGEGGSSNWLQGLNQCQIADGCGVDVTAVQGQQIVRCSSANDECALYEYTGSNSELQGIFGHRATLGWTKTSFVRKVFVEEVQRGVEASVLVEMTWKAGSLGSRTLRVSENLLNWYVSE